MAVAVEQDAEDATPEAFIAAANGHTVLLRQ